MNFVYNAAIRALKGAVAIGAHSKPKLRKLAAGQKASLEVLQKMLPAEVFTVWIHAASLGEFEQGRPVIEHIKKEHPDWRIVLTFFSPSGYEVRKNYPLADVVMYLPFDTPENVDAFLAKVQPDVALFIKYEFWGNYLEALKKRRIPTYLISGIFRPGQIFFKPWGAAFRKMLRCFTGLLVQDENSLELLQNIGIRDAIVIGDTRFDRVADVKSQQCHIPKLNELMRPDARGLRMVVGSSWPEDETVYSSWLNAHSEVKFLIAPHEFDEKRIAGLLALFPNRKVMSLSQWQASGYPLDVDGLIVDSFGHLSALYRFADVAYIGGGFGAGIHNINEAAVYGIPVIFGPNNKKFKEAVDLLELGGAHQVYSGSDFTELMDFYADFAQPSALSDRTAQGAIAGKYIADHLGATDKAYKIIFEKNRS